MPNRLMIEQFLAQQHLAVVGVSRRSGEFANSVYRHLRTGRTLYPVNVHAQPDTVIEDDRAFARLADVPDPLDGVVVMVPPSELLGVLGEVVERGVSRVWIHRGLGQPPVEREAVAFCAAHGIDVVDGACPLMFDAPVRGMHRVHRFIAGRRIAA